MENTTIKIINGIAILFCILLIVAFGFIGFKIFNLDIGKSDNPAYLVYFVGIICVTLLLTLLLVLITFFYQSKSKYKCLSDLISLRKNDLFKDVELLISRDRSEYNALGKEIESLKKEIESLKSK